MDAGNSLKKPWSSAQALLLALLSAAFSQCSNPLSNSTNYRVVVLLSLAKQQIRQGLIELVYLN